MATAIPSKWGPAPQEDVGSSLGLPGENRGKAGFLAWDVAEQEVGRWYGRRPGLFRGTVGASSI